MSDHLVVERRDAIATVTLNRPEVHNALNVATYGDLPDLVRELEAPAPRRQHLREADDAPLGIEAPHRLPLVASDEERLRVGAASRAYAEEVHDLERMTDRLLDLYASLH